MQIKIVQSLFPLRCFGTYPFILFIILRVFWISVFPATAGDMAISPSFQGYTGLLNTPNALTAGKGTVFAAFSNHTEYDRRHINGVENYFFSLELIPCLEIGGRFTEEGGLDRAPDARRDLSAHLKFRIPRIFDSPLIPDIAVGSQDPSGGSSFYRSNYLVITQEIHRARLSLGFGIGPDRMEGVFGGAEIKLFDWFRLIGEYDTEETNLGIELMTPESLSMSGFRFGATGKTSTVDDFATMDFSVYAAIPIGGRDELRKTSTTVPTVESRQTTKPANETSVENRRTDKTGLSTLIDRLGELGFENVAVAQLKNALYVEYENNRYNHNELDGLGLVLGTASEYLSDHRARLFVVVKEVDLPLLTIEAEKTDLDAFFHDNGPAGRFSSSLDIKNANGFFSRKNAAGHAAKHHRSILKPRLSIYPGLTTFIGTDYSALDYLVSIRPDLRLDLWPGGMVGAVWDIPAYWTNEFDDGEAFNSYRNDARLERIMFHQAVKVSSGVTAVISVGRYYEDTTGVLAEAVWSPGTGKHRFSLKAGAFENENNLKKEVGVGAYRYYYSPLDLSIEGKYGQYWAQDKGFLFKLNRFFKDTAVYSFYRHVGSGEGERAVGIGFSLPLTPKRDMKPRIAQVTGASRWAYEHQITVADSGEKNPINTNIAVVPNTGYGLDRIYFNGDRLNEAYIRRHTERLRQSYLKWGT